MTNQELIDYYANLLPKQYVTQPNAFATIELLAELGLMPQNIGVDINADPILPLAIIPAFNIQTAVGQQLEFMAESIGGSRYGTNLSGQAVTLNDSDYRLLLQAVQARNYLRATTAEIDSFISRFFSGILRVRDEQEMRMSYTYLATLGTQNWAELFITQKFLPRPLGVEMDFVIGANFFGCRTYLNGPPSWVRPACTYSAPVSSPTPILLYSDGITP